MFQIKMEYCFVSHHTHFQLVNHIIHLRLSYHLILSSLFFSVFFCDWKMFADDDHVVPQMRSLVINSDDDDVVEVINIESSEEIIYIESDDDDDVDEVINILNLMWRS
ncbi:hypothetical protein LINPERPRIM_LOCUS29524 [Linum perenne]